MSSSSTLERAKSALIQSLLATQPELNWANAAYLADPEDNVLPHLRAESWPSARPSFEAGDGGELTSSDDKPAKFAAAYSSSALGFNSFGPWMGRSQQLVLDQITSFDGSMEFEAKCANGIGPRPSNLDVLLNDGIAYYGVESKLTEYIASSSKKPPSPAYVDLGDDDPRRHTKWFEVMKGLVDGSVSFKHLDAGQLVKHLFGLAHTYNPNPVRVVYVYWAPTNASEFSEFADHRSEIDRFAEMVAMESDHFLFESISYPEHWRELDEIADEVEWLSAHLAAVRARYEIAI